MPRELSAEFLDSLKQGHLQCLLDRVKTDHTLCLEIRDDYLNIYYRGGSAIRLDGPAGGFSAQFDEKYCVPDGPELPQLPPCMTNLDECAQWVDALPVLKQSMDLWFGTVRHTIEREVQQAIVLSNNFGPVANSTDYFICDIEYTSEGVASRFDMVAVKWLSTAHARQNPEGLRLVLVEVKYGEGALAGKSGLVDHVNALNTFLAEEANLVRLKKEMVNVYRQKHGLGLIEGAHPIESFTNKKLPQYLLILADHDPASTVLHRELEELPECPKAEIVVATASPMGYGLHTNHVIPLEEYKKQLEEERKKQLG